MFAKLNKLRSAQSDQLISSAGKEMNRQDFGQQKNRYDEQVSFDPSQSITHSAVRKKISVKRKGNSLAFQGNAKDVAQHTIRKSQGGKNTVSAAATWDSGGYQERAKPTILEQKGLLTNEPPKVPSLIKGDMINGRHPRKLQNKNSTLFKRNRGRLQLLD